MAIHGDTRLQEDFLTFEMWRGKDRYGVSTGLFYDATIGHTFRFSNQEIYDIVIHDNVETNVVNTAMGFAVSYAKALPFWLEFSVTTQSEETFHKLRTLMRITRLGFRPRLVKVGGWLGYDTAQSAFVNTYTTASGVKELTFDLDDAVMKIQGTAVDSVARRQGMNITQTKIEIHQSKRLSIPGSGVGQVSGDIITVIAEAAITG